MRFNDGWVPYEERGAWLLQADCAVAAHRDHLETRFSHRTRLLDCLWAGLPIVCTRGDELAERIARDGLGEAVPPSDPGALAAALARVLERGRSSYAAALAAAAEELRWSRVAEPLAALVSADGPCASLGARAGRRRPRSPAPRARRGRISAQTALNAVGPRLAARPLNPRMSRRPPIRWSRRHSSRSAADEARHHRVQRARVAGAGSDLAARSQGAREVVERGSPPAQHRAPRAGADRAGERVGLVAEDQRRPGEQPPRRERLEHQRERVAGDQLGLEVAHAAARRAAEVVRDRGRHPAGTRQPASCARSPQSASSR